MDKMVRERNGWKRAVSLLLALCIAATLTVFTPAYAADTSWKKIDTIETAKGKNGEYMQVKTPLNTANTLMVSGKVPSATKMVLITVKGVADNQYYVRTFVKPASDGSFSVTIKTGVGTTATPKATAGKVYSASDRAYDSMPGYCPVGAMPVGLYRLAVTTADTAKDAEVCNGAKWYQGVLNGDSGYALEKVYLAATASGNDLKLVEFSGVVNASQKVRASESISDGTAYARYTDVRLKDMTYLLKDSQTRAVKPMTESRAAYIQNVAQEVTAGASTNYEKLRRIYYYVTQNFYYDYYAFSKGLTEKQNCNPYDLLYNLRNKVASPTSTADGKVATVCDGYSALVVSMCRTLGIPARSVCGGTVTAKGDISVSVNTSKPDHWWAEVYIDGRWVTVDANAGSLRRWNRTSLSDAGTWTDNGINMMGFDASPALYAGRKQMLAIQDDTAGRPFVQTLSASADSATGKPHITWTPLSGYSTYYIYRGTSLTKQSYYTSTKVLGTFVDVDAKSGTTYYYQVRPVNDSKVEGAPSDIVSCKSGGSDLVLAVYTRSDTKGAYLSWSAVSGASKYQVYRGTSAGSLQKWKVYKSTNLLDGETVEGTTYYYKVVPLKSDGSSMGKSTNTVSFTTGGAAPIAPAKPVLKTTYNASSGHIRLQWASVANATSYQLFRSTKRDTGYTQVCTTTSNGFTDTTAQVGVLYYYKLKAFTGSSGSPYSDVVSTRRRCAKPVVKPDYLTSTGKPYLKWSAVTGASKYQVYRSTSKTSGFKLLGTTTKLNYTDTTATAGYTYYYKLKAVDSGGRKSDFGAVVSAICHCARPVAKSDYLTSTGKPYVKWSAVTGASKYQVYRSTSKTGTYKLLGTTTKLSYTDTSATTGYTYYYKVKAVSKVKTSANSAYSKPISIVCHCAKPVVKITTTSGGDPRLTWSTVTGASKYEVYRATSSGGTYTKVATTTAKTYTDKTAKAGKTYYYKVKAVSKVKTSANSAYSAVKSIKAR